jgi:hypothetical protein
MKNGRDIDKILRGLFIRGHPLTSLAAGGGLQWFNLIAMPMTCLHIKFLKNAGQL